MPDKVLKIHRIAKTYRSRDALYFICFVLLSVLYNFLSWRNSFFPAEEAAQYFPKESMGAFLRETHIFDGWPVDGNTLAAVPIGLLTSVFEEKLSSSILILVTQLILNGLICFSAYCVLTLYIDKASFRWMALTCLQFSFVVTNYSQYFSKSLSFVFFCLVLKIVKKQFNVVSLIIIMCGLNFLTIGMLSNLGAAFVGWVAFPLSILLFRRESAIRKVMIIKVFTMFIVTLFFQLPILWKYYFSNNLISEYYEFSNVTETRFGSNLSILTGDGNWMQFDGYGDTKYYNYVLPEGHWTYSFRLAIITLLIIYILISLNFWRRINGFNPQEVSNKIRHLNYKLQGIDFLIISTAIVILIPIEEIEFLERLVRFSGLTAFRDPWMKFEGIFLMFLVVRVFATLELIFREFHFAEKRFEVQFRRNRYSRSTKSWLHSRNRKRMRLIIVGRVLVTLQVVFTPISNLNHQLTFEGPDKPAANMHAEDFDNHRFEAMAAVSKWLRVGQTNSQGEEIICVLSTDPLVQAASQIFLFFGFERNRHTASISGRHSAPKEFVYSCTGKSSDSPTHALKCNYSKMFIAVVPKYCYQRVDKSL